MQNYGSSIQLTDRMTPVLTNIMNAVNMTVSSVYQLQSSVSSDFDASSFDSINESMAQAQVLVDEINRDFNRTGSEIDENTNNQKRFNETIGKGENYARNLSVTISKVASALGLYKIGSELMETASQAVEFASDLTEVQNVVDVTFGSASAIVNDWAANALDAYGLNELSAKQYAGTMGAMLKSSGVAGDAINEMSMSIAELSGDMASFYNLANDEAFNKIRSGISGETEPLKQLGINMSVANLEAYALSQGITTTYSEMSQGEQVMLRYNYLLEQTADAQGDFARTSDSYANQTKLLEENWSSFTASLAADALPTLSAITQELNSVISFLTEHSDTVQAVLIGLSVTIGILAAAWAIHAAAEWLSVEANKAFVASLLTNPLVWIALAIGAVVAVIYKWIQSVGGLRNAWELAKMRLQVSMHALRSAFYYSIDSILTKIEAFQLRWKTAGVNVADFVGDMKVNVLTTLQNMINGAIGLINEFILKLNTIPGVSIDVISQTTFASTAAAENEAEKQARAVVLAEYESEINAKQAERDAQLSDLQTELNNSVVSLKEAYKNAVELAGTEDDAGAGSNEQSELSSISSNTSDIKDSISASSDDELEWLRKLAERETVNRFTTAEIKLDFSSTATLNSDMDIDGYINTFTTELEEVLVSTAEDLEK